MLLIFLFLASCRAEVHIPSEAEHGIRAQCHRTSWFTFEHCWAVKAERIQEEFYRRQQNCASTIQLHNGGDLGAEVNEFVRRIVSSFELGYAFITGNGPQGYCHLAAVDCPHTNGVIGWQCLFQNTQFCSPVAYSNETTITRWGQLKQSFPKNIDFWPQEEPAPRSDLWNTWMKEYNVPASFLYGQILLFLMKSPQPFLETILNAHFTKFRNQVSPYKKTMCVHYRDLHSKFNVTFDNRGPIPLERYMKHVDEYDVDAVYLASNAKFTAEELALRFPNRKYKFIVADAVTDPTHVLFKANLTEDAVNWIGALLDVLTLSECDSLLMSASNWSTMIAALMKAKRPTSRGRDICSFQSKRKDMTDLSMKALVDAPLECLGSSAEDTFQWSRYIDLEHPAYKLTQAFDAI